MTDTMDVSESFDDLDAEIEAARTEEAGLPDLTDDTGDQGADEGEGEQQDAPPVKDYAKIAEDKSRALKEERLKRRQLEDRLAALESKVPQQEGDDPLKAILEIDEDADPIGAIKALKAMAQGIGKSQEQQAYEQAQKNQLRQIQTRVASYEDEFRAENPDYDEAVKFFAQTTREALEETGLSGQALQQQFESELLGVTLRALSSGRDPAEVAYKLAQKRGFGAKAPEKVDEAAKILQTIDRGQKASKTLGSAGGAKTGSGEITIEMLNKLDGAAFDAAKAKFKEQMKRRA